MKNFTRLIVLGFGIFANTGYGQRGPVDGIDKNQMVLGDMIDERNDVAYYHVVEKINMNFGSRETTYNVPKLSMVSKSEMGPNNSRTITPKYGKVRNKTVAAVVTNTASMVAAKTEISAPLNVVIPIASKPEKVVVEKEDMTVKIDLLRTYERVLDKGYKSIDMLKKVANGRFFDGDLLIALKHYDTLFQMTEDLEPVYYYRYSQCLKADGQNSKASKILEIFKERER